MTLILTLWVKLFFVLTPFFGLTMFLALTEDYDEPRRRRVAGTVAAAVAVTCLILLFAGQQIFLIFGITLDSFRVGSGILLLLTAIGLVNGKAALAKAPASGDFTVVPLAIPIIVGPASMGTLLVLGAELTTLSAKARGSAALLLAVASLYIVLFSGSFIKRILGSRGISILSRLTGLILSALAAQIIMMGIKGFFSA